MIRFLIALFFVTSKVILAQNISFDYQISYTYRFQTNKSDTNSRKIEEMVLFANTKQSYFISKNKLILDSIVSQMEINGSSLSVDMQKLPKVKANFTIEKYLFDKKGFYNEYIVNNTYRAEYKFEEIQWTLTSLVKKIGNYSCKQAKTTFAGRNYTAWYAEEIPISDGPYKFSGLPGLIVEIYDEKNEHYFTLNYLKKQSKTLNVKQQKIVLTTMKEINKAKKNKFEMMKANGLSVQVTPEQEKLARERWTKNTNYIEVY